MGRRRHRDTVAAGISGHEIPDTKSRSFRMSVGQNGGWIECSYQLKRTHGVRHGDTYERSYRETMHEAVVLKSRP